MEKKELRFTFIFILSSSTSNILSSATSNPIIMVRDLVDYYYLLIPNNMMSANAYTGTGNPYTNVDDFLF